MTAKAILTMINLGVCITVSKSTRSSGNLTLDCTNKVFLLEVGAVHKELIKKAYIISSQMETSKLEQDNASQDLRVYSNHKLDSIVEIYDGEADSMAMAWIDKAKDKT